MALGGWGCAAGTAVQQRRPATAQPVVEAIQLDLTAFNADYSYSREHLAAFQAPLGAPAGDVDMVAADDPCARPLRADSAVLARWSEPLARMLDSGMREAQERRVALHGVDHSTLTVFLELLHRHHTTVEPHVLIPLLSLSDQLCVPGLQAVCTAAVRAHLGHHTCCYQFHCAAREAGLADISALTWSALVSQLGDLAQHTAVFAALELADIVALCGHTQEAAACSNAGAAAAPAERRGPELVVFRALMAWLDAGEERQAHAAAVYACVDWGRMTAAELAQLRYEPRMSTDPALRDLVLDACLVRLADIAAAPMWRMAPPACAGDQPPCVGDQNKT